MKITSTQFTELADKAIKALEKVKNNLPVLHTHEWQLVDTSGPIGGRGNVYYIAELKCRGCGEIKKENRNWD